MDHIQKPNQIQKIIYCIKLRNWCETTVSQKKLAMQRSFSSPSINKCITWLEPTRLSKVIHPGSCTKNEHGVKTQDHIDVKWPLPNMFGDESYAFALIDITDPRFSFEATAMSKKLIHLFYDLQIIEYEWRRVYKHFLETEARKEKLTPGVLQKSRDKAFEEYNSAREQLLRLQDQRDLFEDTVQRIFDRCKQIKTSITKERGLEELRERLKKHVQTKFPAGHPFWDMNFDLHLTRNVTENGVQKHHNHHHSHTGKRTS